MLYHAFEIQKNWLAGASALATAGAQVMQHPANPLGYFGGSPMFASALEVFAHAAAPRGKPGFELYETVVDGETVRVTEVIEARKPFGQLKHFKHKGTKDAPKLLIVAPMSGHYATLLRGTVETLLPSADIYITDWKDARMVPLSEGRFDLDDYIDYVIEMLHHLGEDTHVIAVCQPAVPVLAAVARMEAEKDPFSPSSMTLMGGPIDTRVNPTAVNLLAKTRPLSWFEENVIMPVPWPQPGVMRQVYPGFLQLSGFMSMNLDRHMIAHKDFFVHLVKNDGDSADKHRDFYDEYLAVMDLTAEFYLQTVDTVFIKHALPKGEMMHRGKPVDLSKIVNTALLTVEGENDDISGVGQTEAAQRLCSNLPAHMRQHYLQPDVGHYGVFNGSRFRREIAPRIVKFMQEQSKENRAGMKSKVRVIEGGKRRNTASGK